MDNILQHLYIMALWIFTATFIGIFYITFIFWLWSKKHYYGAIATNSVIYVYLLGPLLLVLCIRMDHLWILQDWDLDKDTAWMKWFPVTIIVIMWFHIVIELILYVYKYQKQPYEGRIELAVAEFFTVIIISIFALMHEYLAEEHRSEDLSSIN